MIKATNTNTTEATDPIFAAIDAHKAAVINGGLTLDRNMALDRELPAEKCLSHITLWKEEIVATDDPRWIECERDWIAAYHAEADAALALVSVLPTTSAGLLALLQYAVTAAETDTEVWDKLLDEDGNRERPWHHFLIANTVKILPGMVSA